MAGVVGEQRPSQVQGGGRQSLDIPTATCAPFPFPASPLGGTIAAIRLIFLQSHECGLLCIAAELHECGLPPRGLEEGR